MTDDTDAPVKTPEEAADYLAATLDGVAEAVPGINPSWREIPVGAADQMGTWLRNRLLELGADEAHKRSMAAGVAVALEVIAQNSDGHLFLPLPAVAGLVVMLDHLTGRVR